MKTSIISLIISIICGINLFSQNSFTDDNPEIRNKLDSYINGYTKTGDFSGCIAIINGVSIVYQECFGFANQSFKVPNEVNTKFKIGSVSKQFIASAILILEQQGLLKTTDTLSKFFPNHSNAERITITNADMISGDSHAKSIAVDPIRKNETIQ